MVLTQLKQFLKATKTANLAMISRFINADPQAVRGMLELLVGKGCIRRCERASGCASICGKCNPHNAEVYEWIAT